MNETKVKSNMMRNKKQSVFKFIVTTAFLSTASYANESFDPLGLWSGEVSTPSNASSNSSYQAPKNSDDIDTKIRKMQSKNKPVDQRSLGALKPFNPKADISLDLAEPTKAKLVMEAELERLKANQVTSGVHVPIEGGTLKPGAVGDRVYLLSQGLINLGYYKDKPTRKYNANLGTALKQFQSDNGLDADGFAGKNTLDILNGAGNFRQQAIEYTLKKKPQDIPLNGKVIVVNIASQGLRAYESGRLVLTSKVVVGKDQYFTPEFMSPIESISINPTWNVPKGISSRQYEGRKVAVSPGPDNPLGKLRFNMYNRHTIYLHHTNNPSLFNMSRRALSAGCIRVEKAYDLAQWLAGNQWYTFQGGFDSILSTNNQHTLKLPQKVPVYIEYRPVEVFTNGQIKVWNDPYGRVRQSIS